MGHKLNILRTEYDILVVFQNGWLERVEYELGHVVDVGGDGEVHWRRLLEDTTCLEVGHRTLYSVLYISRCAEGAPATTQKPDCLQPHTRTASFFYPKHKSGARWGGRWDRGWALAGEDG